MTEAERLHDIIQVKLETIRRAEIQMGDNPNIYRYMDSYATLMQAHATSLVALELNHLNTILLNKPTRPVKYDL